MYLDHTVIQRIARVLDQIDGSVLLMDEQGSVLYPEGDQRQLTLPEAVKANPSEPLVYGGVTLIGNRVEHHLQREEDRFFLCLTGDSPEVRNCAILCAELIGTMLRVDMDNTDKAQALRLILRGEADDPQIEALAATHNIPMKRKRCVMMIYCRESCSDLAMRRLAEVCDPEEDYFVDVSRHILLLMKALPEESDYDVLNEQAWKLRDTFNEADMKVVIGVSDPRDQLTDMSDAMLEARSAINVGNIYRPSEDVFIFHRLLLERFLDTVPQSSGGSYGATLFNPQTARLFNEEMVNTIEAFFDNNLNLSEAARKLYIHRNTLVYRLEKVQRATGFDLREFDDAVTFKLMMLLSRNANAPKQKI